MQSTEAAIEILGRTNSSLVSEESWINQLQLAGLRADNYMPNPVKFMMVIIT
jgi:hypothetical protein